MPDGGGVGEWQCGSGRGLKMVLDRTFAGFLSQFLGRLAFAPPRFMRGFGI